jgi:hypothetical protein
MKVLASLLVIFFSAQVAPPSNSDWEWLRENRAPALEALMPTEAGDQTLVTYRSYRDLYHDVEERYFSIRLAPEPSSNAKRFEATVVIPTGKSIQQQILDLRMRDRSKPLDVLLPQVAVRRIAVNSEQCPALRSRVDALSKTKISLAKQDVLYLHPLIHNVSIGIYGSEVKATLYDRDNPIVRWAMDTLDAILACSASARHVAFR